MTYYFTGNNLQDILDSLAAAGDGHTPAAPTGGPFYYQYAPGPPPPPPRRFMRPSRPQRSSVPPYAYFAPDSYPSEPFRGRGGPSRGYPRRPAPQTARQPFVGAEDVLNAMFGGGFNPQTRGYPFGFQFAGQPEYEDEEEEEAEEPQTELGEENAENAGNAENAESETTEQPYDGFSGIPHSSAQEIGSGMDIDDHLNEEARRRLMEAIGRRYGVIPDVPSRKNSSVDTTSSPQDSSEEPPSSVPYKSLSDLLDAIVSGTKAAPTVEEPESETEKTPAPEPTSPTSSGKPQTRKRTSSRSSRPSFGKKSSNASMRSGPNGPSGSNGSNIPSPISRIQVSSPTSSSSAFAPPLDVYDLEKAYVIRASVPGASASAFELDFHPVSNELVISGSVEPRPFILAEGGADSPPVIQEHRLGKFERSVRFPVLPRIDDDAMKAKYVDGLLEIYVPKVTSEPEKPKRKIVISEVQQEKSGKKPNSGDGNEEENEDSKENLKVNTSEDGTPLRRFRSPVMEEVEDDDPDENLV